MSDADWIAKVQEITDPLKMLQAWSEAESMLSDFYYRDLVRVLIAQTDKILEFSK